MSAPAFDIPDGDIDWHTAPGKHGQMVDVSYGVDDKGRCWRRDFDRSGGHLKHYYLGEIVVLALGMAK